MKVLLLADIPGWIVDRITDRMIAELPDIEFRKGFYGCMATDEILEAAADVDLIHYGNWDIERHWPKILEARKPILMSVRSHRFQPYVREVAKQVHVHAISPSLAAAFPGSHYIPDGLMIEPRLLCVGFAGNPCPYKGNELIEKACMQIGAGFVTAVNVHPNRMEAWYRSIDVLVCASENEGFCAPVMEALALNKPVISTRCGAACENYLPGVTWVDRSIDDIKDALLRHWPSRHLEPFSWPRVCEQMRELYHVLSD